MRKKSTIIFVLTLFFGSSAIAASTCELVQQLQQQLGCTAAGPAATTTPSEPSFVMSSKFGPTQCKIARALEEENRSFEKKCEKWIEKQKVHLKDRFLTGSCEKNCAKCGGMLEKCTYQGTIHYSKK